MKTRGKFPRPSQKIAREVFYPIPAECFFFSRVVLPEKIFLYSCLLISPYTVDYKKKFSLWTLWSIIVELYYHPLPLAEGKMVRSTRRPLRSHVEQLF